MASAPRTTDRPRVLRVSLDELRRGAPVAGSRLESWRHADPALDALGRQSGSALAVALLSAAARRAPRAPAPLVIAVGECVRRGVPTAARACFASRSPLTGALALGFAGGDLASRLAGLCDALVIEPPSAGEAAKIPSARAGSVDSPPLGLLRVGASGARLVSAALLAGLDPAETWRRASAALAEGKASTPEAPRADAAPGDPALIRIGPAGEARIPFAGLVSGGERGSFTGRGGLGAVLGAFGLKAIAIESAATRAEAAHAGAGELLELLSRSPRLLARSGSGTLELLHAQAARGSLAARNYAEPIGAERGAALANDAEQRARARHGCRGCPTPCGWEFETSSGARRAHFGAAYALGPNVGLESFGAALELHAVCDELGLDAREAGACLALLCRARERGARDPGARQTGAPDPGPEWGDGARLAELCREAVRGDGLGRRMRVGAAALARELGLEGEVVLARGQAARPEADLASVLGQCVTPGGSDPMRSFAFLSSDGDRALLERLLGAFEPPPGAEDPRDPAGKGLVVWWHESLAAALDVTGFCSFSAAGLLADGVLDLDRLAELVLPASLAADEGFAGSPPGERLLALGASFVLAARALNREWGAPDLDRSAAFAEALDAPGMLALYRACRGLDARGAPTTDALAAAWTPRAGRPFGTRGDAPLRAQPSTEVEVGRVEGGGWWDRGAERAAPTGANASTREEPSASARPERAPGLVRLRAVGPLAERLGRARELRMALPASAREVLGAAAVRAPAAAAWLGVDERPGADGPGAEGPGAGAGADTRSAAPPAVYRDGRRLGADELVRDGDVLDLVLALAGG